MTVTQTRRTIPAGAAAVPALSPPAMAVERGDPIFALIERHRIAESAYDNAYKSESLEQQANDLQAESSKLYAQLLATTPTTLAGCAAMLRHVEEYAAKYESSLYYEWSEPYSVPGASLLSRIAAVLEPKA